MSKSQGIVGRLASSDPLVGSVISAIVVYWLVTEIVSYSGEEWLIVGTLAAISYVVLDQ